MKNFIYITRSIFLVCALFVITSYSIESLVTMSNIKTAAQEYIQAKEDLAAAQKRDKEFASKYKDYRDSYDSFKKIWKGIPDHMKEDYVDLATQVSQKVEGIKEGKSAKKIIEWGAKWKVRKPVQPAPSKTDFDHLAVAAKDFVSKYTIILKEQQYTRLRETTKQLKELVRRYIKEDGKVSELLEALQFIHSQKVINKVHEWIAKGIIQIADE